MFLTRFSIPLALALFVGPAAPLAVADSSPPAGELAFNEDVRPILSDRCFTCHGPDSATRSADLRLDTAEGAHDWAIVPGEADASEVYSRVTSDDPDLVMPPPESGRKPISKAEAELLRRWIEQGAEYQAHWAYLPVVKSELPQIENADWASNPIDNFVLASLEANKLEPAPQADKRTLLRRLYFDLTGLPPKATDVAEFLNDDRPDAYERLVDKLLASPHYGERMATWWFDLVRFANTVGYHGDQHHASIPYRDYVIKSFNDNLPYDQFTIEQLAGDLVPEPTMWQKVASGYNRLLQTTHEGGAQDREYLAIHLADRVRNFGEVWLAASTGCAQCHDHKFDPITQKDFFSLGAFFADVDHYGSFAPVSRNATLTERPPEILAWTLPVYEAIVEVDNKIAELESKLRGRMPNNWEELRQQLTDLKRERVDLEGKFVRALVTEATKPRTVRVLNRGDWMDTSGEVVEPATPHFLKQLDTTGRRANRLDLAKWVVDGDNPLAGRTAVNRLWGLFFGRGLSEGLIDMGSQAEWPTHPELLDWLAAEFVDCGWDTKHMVRLMVTSNTYKQSSVVSAKNFEVDPKNKQLARQSRSRLDAEMIRDNALAVSGLLNLSVGGESGLPYQPAGYYAQMNFPQRKYKAAKGELQFRRGVYTHWQRQYLHPWLLAFDAPNREECTAKRAVSNTPSAALVLLNDPSFVEAARTLAARVLIEAEAETPARIAWLWQQVLSREPSSDESAAIAALLEKHRIQFDGDTKAATQLAAVGISPQAEGLDPAEHAAWTSVCRVLLNLNETISRN